MRYFVVLVTASSMEEAMRIARRVVEEKLAACVNIVNGVRSVYVWKGNVEEGSEVLLIMKTREDVLQRLIERVKELHSYEVPEVIAIEIANGLSAYLEWIDRVVEGRE
ncbi:MAG: divalent-cation tolerance protein CutA [Crenarchaeota archaeon]|nr:divalent-cation tolerance protein CutA [Thermoproteota archaeon]